MVAPAAARSDLIVLVFDQDPDVDAGGGGEEDGVVVDVVVDVLQSVLVQPT